MKVIEKYFFTKDTNNPLYKDLATIPKFREFFEKLYKDRIIDYDIMKEYEVSHSINFSLGFNDSYSKELKHLIKDYNFINNINYHIMFQYIYNRLEINNTNYFALNFNNGNTFNFSKMSLNSGKFGKKILCPICGAYEISQSDYLTMNSNSINKKHFVYIHYYSNLYFISESLFNYLKQNNYTGYETLPVNNYSKNDHTTCYQFKVTNEIVHPIIPKELSPLKDFPMHYVSNFHTGCKYFMEYQAPFIYEKEYIDNSFKDFNYVYSYCRNDDQIKCGIILSKRAKDLLKSKGLRFYAVPVLSLDQVKLEI